MGDCGSLWVSPLSQITAKVHNLTLIGAGSLRRRPLKVKRFLASGVNLSRCGALGVGPSDDFLAYPARVSDPAV